MFKAGYTESTAVYQFHGNASKSCRGPKGQKSCRGPKGHSGVSKHLYLQAFDAKAASTIAYLDINVVFFVDLGFWVVLLPLSSNGLIMFDLSACWRPTRGA